MLIFRLNFDFLKLKSLMHLSFLLYFSFNVLFKLDFSIDI